LNTIANRLARLLFLRDRQPVKVNGHKVLLGDRQLPSLAFINSFVHERYEIETCALLNSLITEGMTVFDVGAHVGHYTLLAAKRVGLTGHVYAFEPEPENYALLVKNVELNGYSNITCVNMAISDRTDLLTFYVSREGNDLHSLIDQSSLAGATRIQVPAISLDEYSASAGLQNIDLIKIDIEGAELLAVAGISRLLEQSGRLLMILEFAPELIRRGGKPPLCMLQSLLDNGLEVSAIEGAVSGPIVAKEDMHAVVSEAERRGAINLLCTKPGGRRMIRPTVI